MDGLYLSGYFTDKIDFNPVPGMTADRADWDGGLITLDALTKAGREIYPEFMLLSGMARDFLTTVIYPAPQVPLQDTLFGTAMKHWTGVAKAGS